MSGGDYHGRAKDAAGYIRESIVESERPRAAGPHLLGGGRSFMPPDYGETLKGEQMDQIVAYLLTLK